MNAKEDAATERNNKTQDKCLQRLFIEKPQFFWDNVLRTDESKVYAENQLVHRQQSEAPEEKHCLPTVKTP